MVPSILKVCVPLVIAVAALAGCGKQSDENAGTPPPAPESTAAPSPAMPAPSSTAMPAPSGTAAKPAYPQSAPAPSSTTH